MSVIDPSPVLDAPVLADLQRRRCSPSVTLVLATAPGAGLGAADRWRLRGLLAEAAGRLAAERTPAGVAEEVLGRLGDLVAVVGTEPTRRGLVLCASPGHGFRLHVESPVRERVVVDDTYATRDLVLHARRQLPVHVVVMSERRAVLLDAAANGLDEVWDNRFPLWREPGERIQRWLLRTSAVVREHVRRHPEEPVVLVGVERLLAEVIGRSGIEPAGIVRGNWDRRSWDALHERVWPVVERWLHGRDLDAVARLDRARGAGRVAEGITEVWAEACDGRVELLVAEVGYEEPARVMGPLLQPAADRESADVVDDAVDEVGELVARAGGAVVFVPDGTLAGAGRIAAILRW